MAIRVAWFIAALALLPPAAAAQTPDNILLVVNSDSPASTQIAAHYVKVRKVPERNVVRLHAPVTDAISRLDYVRTIEEPISSWLTKHRLQDQILYIVLTKGIPLRIDGTLGLSGTMASVDSELTLLYRQFVQSPVSIVSRLDNPNRADSAALEGTRFARQADMYFVTALTRDDAQLSLLQRPVVGEQVPVSGRVDNPYFLGDRSAKDATRFSRLTSDLYLVTRLDGFTVEDVIKLIDRGAAPAGTGAIVLDQKATVVDRGGDMWLAETATRLRAMTPAPAVQFDTTRAVATSSGPVLGYFSWGSNDPANQRRVMGLAFANGAIGGMFVSTDGRTFREPPAAWQPAIAGSSTGGQSLAGDLVREGITGVSANVAEPLLDAIVRPQILFPAYLSGFNLAESFYLAMPYLSWQEIVLGDPLCAPFPRAPLTRAEFDKGMDDSTDMPAMLAERRLAVLSRSNLKVEALKLFLKASVARLDGKPETEIYALLSRATTIEPRFTLAHLMLAQSADARGEVDESIVHYRPVVAAEPDNAVALNNLAYLLAERKGAAKEALPLAERAYRLSGLAPIIADTLAWVHFKLGDTAAAMPLSARAAQFEPQNVEIQIHAATIHAAANDLPRARTYLDSALKVDPKAADRADVKALAARIR
jgi:uncharacterized protein (TIGR03790 family)